MTQAAGGPLRPEGAADPGADLEYDEAHADLGAASSRPAAEPVQVVTATGAAGEEAGEGGDYAYDLAHDLPGTP